MSYRHWMLKLGFAAVLALAAHGAIAESQKPAPASRVSESQPPKAPAKGNHQKAKQPQRGSEARPLVVKLLNSPDGNANPQSSAEQAKDESAQDWGSVAEWATVYLSALMAFIAFAQLGFFWWQLRLMREGVNDAGKAADAAKASAVIAEKALTHLERPYLFANCARNYNSSSYCHDLPACYYYTITNHGRTPAEIACIETRFCVVPNGEMPPPITLVDITGIMPDGFVVGAGDNVRYEVVLSREVGNADLQRINDRQAELFFLGCVMYCDPFDQLALTGFCFQYSRDGFRFIRHGDKNYNYTLNNEEVEKRIAAMPRGAAAT